MKPSNLKYHVEQTDSHFFDRKTMKFFGDTMANYGVSAKTVFVTRFDDEIVECYELYRKRPVKYDLQKSVYFNIKTFKVVHPKD